MDTKVTIVEEKFYGRLKSRKLTPRQSNLFDTLFKDISIQSFKDIDLTGYLDLYLEIGFGSGEHIAQLAMQNPNALFIGCEPFINGVASLLHKIDTFKIPNIRIYQNDARNLIKEIPNESLSGAFLLFPDPWPKRKHIRRRFLQEKTILEMYSKLKPNGQWKVASDHKEYKAWILKLFSIPKIQQLFAAQTFNKATRPPKDIWPETRYEQKSVDDILYALYTKIAK